MKRNKLLAVALSTAMVAGALTGCGGGSEEAKKDDSKGSVYYLNFKPEVAEVWEEVAKKYTEETGVDVKVVTAASGNYESTLKSEIAKTDAPTLFQINGPIGYQSWKDYCADLSDTDFYKSLSDQSLAIKGEDGGVYGVPYTIEGYGIIYNDEIMQKYFATSGAKAATTDEINSFDKLKEVVEDMQSKKDELGIEGVFASTSLLPGEDWRWQTHLADLPIYAEYNAKDVDDLDTIEFTYNDKYKNIFDLYIENSCTEPTMLGSKGVNDSMAEFALGKVAMVQNGNWAWGQISETQGNVVKEENIKFMPIYCGLDDEANQGLCIGTENYFAINSKASEASQKASVDFVNWLISSETGKDYMTNKLGNNAPFTTFSDSEKPSDPLAQDMLGSMESGKTSIPWVFTTFPSQTFKDNFGAALLEYAQGTKTWEDVVSYVNEQWATEKAAVAE
ncbi:MAG: extracellular solute-binding protein [Lachnospiraceae bacterium]|nr:extracellular solute-binding protein [Lachnospiraceae bacterium]MBQ2319764.1 extracellular solute-binding protein [Lachnospiraceae bacterium]